MSSTDSIQNFNCVGDPSTVGPRWRRWRRSFEIFVQSKEIQAAQQKKALLLHCAGPDVQDIYYTLEEEDVTEGNDVYIVAMNALEKYFLPQVNTPYERHLFRNMSQQENETINQFVTRLKQRADLCEFVNVKEQIRDQIIEKCLSTELRRKCLEKGQTLTLEDVQKIARSLEDSHRQANTIENENQNSEVNRVQYSRRGRSRYKDRHYNSNSNTYKKKIWNKDRNSRSKSRTRMTRCYRCGNSGHFQSSETCPARRKRCLKCNLYGHFANMCNTKISNRNTEDKRKSSQVSYLEENENVNSVTDESCKEEDDYIFSVIDSRMPTIKVNIGGVKDVEMIVDSGASCNVIDKTVWTMLKKNKVKCILQKKINKFIHPYGGAKPIKVIGLFVTNLIVDNVKIESEIKVIENSGNSLLGYKSAMALGILKLKGINFINNVDTCTLSINDIIKQYNDCFIGLGKLKNFQLELPIDANVKPIAQQMRRIPFNLRHKVEEKLNNLEQLDVIEKVYGPTPWVSPIVILLKRDKDIRLCVDMRQANSAIIRERHPIPTVDEILHDLNESTIFSKLDIKWAFHQIELNEASRMITTFITHKGLYRYKRLMFGISCAPEMYQRVIQQALSNCEGVRNIFDDIIVHGKNESEHNERLVKLLQLIKKLGLTLNKEKCNFCMSQLEFMGHLLTDRGIGPTKSKVGAIVNARKPESASEIRSFLGLVNYSARYIPNLSTISEPLRMLTKKNIKFEWGPDQEKSFNSLKQCLADVEILGYFNRADETYLITDASLVGLGAVLIQNQKGEHRVISYASRSLTDVEKRYSQTEKEALGIIWACERFHMYLYGCEFNLLTDHKPLEFIYSKRSKPSAHIERWVLRLQPYRFKISYIKGQDNIADSLSRLIKRDDISCVQNIDKLDYEHVKFVCESSVPKALTTKEIETYSSLDSELSNIRDCIKTEHWHKIQNKLYLSIRTELCVIGTLLLRGTRIVIPLKLREQVLSLAHEGHPGIVVMKRRLRSKVYWPGIDKDAEHYCKSCKSCQIVGTTQPQEPIIPSTLPSGPWQHIAIDLMTPSLPSGDHLLVVVDYYSRYIEVAYMKSTITDKVIEQLKKIFLIHGYPLSITSDNGPQFISQEFKDYLEFNGIKHRRTTPLWPQANGEVERQNRSLLKRLRIAQVEQRNWKDELYNYLMMYRSTPHSVTGVSPAELLFKRQIRTRLPGIDEVIPEDTEFRDRDAEQKGKGKMYADEKRRVRESDLKIGDKVLLKQKPVNKLTATFESNPYKVISKTGNSIVVKNNDGVEYRRNTSHVKKFIDRLSLNTRRLSENIESDNLDDTSHDTDQNKESNLETNQEVNDSEVKSRPSREIRLPVKFKDFEMK